MDAAYKLKLAKIDAARDAFYEKSRERGDKSSCQSFFPSFCCRKRRLFRSQKTGGYSSPRFAPNLLENRRHPWRLDDFKVGLKAAFAIPAKVILLPFNVAYQFFNNAAEPNSAKKVIFSSKDLKKARYWQPAKEINSFTDRLLLDFYFLAADGPFKAKVVVIPFALGYTVFNFGKVPVKTP